MNRALPKVSVITITYGHEKYITETLDGVLMQQYDGPVEFIIANDNSPDATDEVVKKYFLENPAPSNFEIKYTKHETNKGMMPNFIWALEQATGKYIALCEGDDYWTESLKLQKQVDFLEENEDYSMIFSNADVIVSEDASESNRSRGMHVIKNSMYYSPQYFFDNWMIPTASVLFRSSVLGEGVYKHLRNCKFMFSDIVLFLCLARKGKVYGSSEIMVAYRRHGGGATNFNLNIVFYEKHLHHLREIGRVFRDQVNLKKHYFTMADYSLSLAFHNLNSRNYFTGLKYLFTSIRYKPAVFLQYLKKKTGF